MERNNHVPTFLPNGKKRGSIEKRCYDSLSSFILLTLTQREDVKLSDLLEQAPLRLSEIRESEIPWYVLLVKQDLEARGLITMNVLPFERLTPYMTLTKRGRKEIRQRRLKRKKA